MKYLILILSLFIIACSTREPANISDKQAKFIKDISIKYAKTFCIKEYENYYRLLLKKPYVDTDDTLVFYLEKNGKNIVKENVITIPIQSVISMSATHIGFLEKLNALEIIKGVQNKAYIYNETIRDAINEGNIFEVGYQQSLNKELILSNKADVLLEMGMPIVDKARYEVIMDAGIPVLIISEWLENTPLARAEWILVMGALLDKLDTAQIIFNDIEKDYLRLKNMTNHVKQKPSVLVGHSFKDVWNVPGGASYAAYLLKDAGADYIWSNDESIGSIHPAFESIYEYARNVDYWLNPGEVFSKKELLERDERIADFLPYQKNKIYVNNKKTVKGAGNDFWESGVVNPNLILSDLIKIFHPDLLPQHDLVYYKKLD